MPAYAKPPITEAVIELRWGDAISRDSAAKARARLNDVFPFEQELKTIKIVASENQAVSVTEDFEALKLRSLDASNILLIGARNFAHSRLPPYLGWEVIYAEAKQYWDVFSRVCKAGPLQRVGVRYINRVDIPAVPGSLLHNEEYLAIYPQVPSVGNVVGDYRITVQMMPDESTRCAIRVESGPVPAPLVDHAAFLLDVDISLSEDLPTRDADIWALINEMGRLKSRVFESLITDKCRELFQ